MKGVQAGFPPTGSGGGAGTRELHKVPPATRPQHPSPPATPQQRPCSAPAQGLELAYSLSRTKGSRRVAITPTPDPCGVVLGSEAREKPIFLTGDGGGPWSRNRKFRMFSVSVRNNLRVNQLYLPQNSFCLPSMGLVCFTPRELHSCSSCWCGGLSVGNYF